MAISERRSAAAIQHDDLPPWPPGRRSHVRVALRSRLTRTDQRARSWVHEVADTYPATAFLIGQRG